MRATEYDNIENKNLAAWLTAKLDSSPVPEGNDSAAKLPTAASAVPLELVSIFQVGQVAGIK